MNQIDNMREQLTSAQPLIDRLRTPVEGLPRPMEDAVKAGLLENTTPSLDEPLERRVQGAWLNQNTRFMKEKDFSWSGAEWQFANACFMAYMPSFVARHRLMPHHKELAQACNEVASTEVTHNAFKLLTEEGLDGQLYNAKDAYLFLGSIIRNATLAFHDRVGTYVEVYPLKVDPVRRISKDQAMVVSEIQGAVVTNQDKINAVLSSVSRSRG